jgi:hypothetical protein
MRMILIALLTFSWLTATPSSNAAGPPLAACSGKQIQSFLKQMTDTRLAIEVYHLDTTQPIVPSAKPPWPNDLAKDPGPLTLASERCVDEARAALAAALRVVPLATGPVKLIPEYCMVHTDAKRKRSLLWVDTDPSRLQMQLFVSGSDQRVDCSGVRPDIRDAIRDFLRAVRTSPGNGYPHIVDMVNMIINADQAPVQIELMSLDPKPTDNLFGEKRWNVIGKVAIPNDDKPDQDAIIVALDMARDSGLPDFARQPYTAHVFSPRLAISVKSAKTQDRPSQEYMLLMSFDCRLAEVYIDHKFKGCSALNHTWRVDKTLEKFGVGVGVAPDQLLNDILVAAGQSLKPKSASSSN